ncbi:butyrate kinase [Fusibacter paucivorans]|uniref:Probable butyrate kinase n=1 Tax=Fusibacter paucivorans TaxID=76009 RepID=A0ABS5PNV8_9FIRM|nr:butyrate kinase [Fusibacter paucivorans]MBS7526736.1 butyrate kinase [Fusibacter paucivorans]
MAYQVLVMNFGSTSTKLAVYKDTTEILKESIQHDSQALKAFEHTMDQKDYRKQAVYKWLTDHGYVLDQFDAIISRGGNCKPIPGGIFEITQPMIDDINTGLYGIHPAGIGCTLAYEFGKLHHVPALTAYPPVTDEFCELARFSGIRELKRISSFHALNHKAIAKRHCESEGLSYESINLIVVHLGGGVSVAAHQRGKMIDANNALDGDGPFAPERSGTLPVGDLVKMCYSGQYTEREMLKKITGGGGLMSYLGTASALDVEAKISAGNEDARNAYAAMAFQIAKAIGGAAAVLKGDIKGILFTGSIAYSEMFVNMLKSYIDFIAPVYVYAGENEMLSLAENAYRYLTKSEKPLIY